MPAQPLECANTNATWTGPRITPRPQDGHHELSDVNSLDASSPHPISCMQGAFDESIMESVTPSPRVLREKLSAEARRRQILELDDFSQAYSSRWRQQPGAKFHPLYKLVAQISFGIHLLHKNLAVSEQEVIRILQSHVDEVDSFAEDTTADFDLAIQDVRERIHLLLLPLQHSRTFNKMLCDKTFRTSILEGNDIIERIIDRTKSAMEHALQDVVKGLDAVVELGTYLDRLGEQWAVEDPQLLDAYHIMQGNAEGWSKCFQSLQAKGDRLKDLMTRLERIVDEVAMRAGIASRRKTPTGVVGKKQQTTPLPSPTLSKPRSRPASSQTLDKPLPPPPLVRPGLSESPFSSATPSSSPSRQKTSHGSSEPSQSPQRMRPHFDSVQRHPPSHNVSSSFMTSTAQFAVRHSSSAARPIQTSAPRSSSGSETPRPLERVHSTESNRKTSSAIDSAYSSCHETPATSPHQRDHFATPRLSNISTTSPLTAHFAPSNEPRLHKEPPHDSALNTRLPNTRNDSNQAITALPSFKEVTVLGCDNKKHSSLRKASMASVRTLFSKKSPQRDKGGSGGLAAKT